MEKKTLKINEADLRNMVTESVKRLLQEVSFSRKENVIDKDKLQKCLDPSISLDDEKYGVVDFKRETPYGGYNVKRIVLSPEEAKKVQDLMYDSLTTEMLDDYEDTHQTVNVEEDVEGITFRGMHGIFRFIYDYYLDWDYTIHGDDITEPSSVEWFTDRNRDKLEDYGLGFIDYDSDEEYEIFLKESDVR